MTSDLEIIGTISRTGLLETLCNSVVQSIPSAQLFNMHAGDRSETWFQAFGGFGG